MDLNTIKHLYDKPLPQIERQLIGWIDLQNLKFAKNIREGTVEYDLNKLYDERIQKPDIVDPKLDSLLQFLQEYNPLLNFVTPRNISESKFFCYRGLLTAICSTPFEKKEPWKIAVMLFMGNIYLCMRNTEEKLLRLQETTEEERKNMAAGLKFEQFLFSDTPDTEPNPDVPCDENEEFNGIFSTKLNKHTIVYGAEIDAALCNNDNIQLPSKDATYEQNRQFLQQLEFIEAKTTPEFSIHHRIEQSFRRYKSGKWWLQSFLVGINKVVCGFKNKGRIVKDVKVFTLEELEEQTEWKTNVCINFLDSFLSFVKDSLIKDINRRFGSEALENIQDLGLVTMLLDWTPGHKVKMSHNWNHAEDVIITDAFRNAFGDSSNRQIFVERSQDEVERLREEEMNETRNEYDNSYGHSSDRGNRGRFFKRSYVETQPCQEYDNSHRHHSARGNRGRFYKRFRTDTEPREEYDNSYGHSSDRGNRGRFFKRSYVETQPCQEYDNSHRHHSARGHRGRFYKRFRTDTEPREEYDNSYGRYGARGNGQSSRGRYRN